MVRLAQEDKEGLVLRNYMLEFLWLDLDKKTRKLAVRFKNALYIYIFNRDFQPCV